MKRWLTRGEEGLPHTVREGGVLLKKCGHKMAPHTTSESHLFFMDLVFAHDDEQDSPSTTYHPGRLSAPVEDRLRSLFLHLVISENPTS